MNKQTQTSQPNTRPMTAEEFEQWVANGSRVGKAIRTLMIPVTLDSHEWCNLAVAMARTGWSLPELVSHLIDQSDLLMEMDSSSVEEAEGSPQHRAIVKALPEPYADKLARFCEREHMDLPAFVATAMDTVIDTFEEDDLVAASHRRDVEDLLAESVKVKVVK